MCRSKARKIIDYIWIGARDLKEESKIIDVGSPGDNVHLTFGEKKLTLGEVTLEMWDMQP
jgi:hypothetical protein